MTYQHLPNPDKVGQVSQSIFKENFGSLTKCHVKLLTQEEEEKEEMSV